MPASYGKYIFLKKLNHSWVTNNLTRIEFLLLPSLGVKNVACGIMEDLDIIYGHLFL